MTYFDVINFEPEWSLGSLIAISKKEKVQPELFGTIVDRTKCTVFVIVDNKKSYSLIQFLLKKYRMASYQMKYEIYPFMNGNLN